MLCSSLLPSHARLGRHKPPPLTNHTCSPLAPLLFVSGYLVPALKNGHYAVIRFLLTGAQHKHAGLPSSLNF